MSMRYDRDVLPPFTSTTQVFRFLVEKSLGLCPQATLPQPLSEPGIPAGSNPEKVIDLARARRAREAGKPVAGTNSPHGVGDYIAR